MQTIKPRARHVKPQHSDKFLRDYWIVHGGTFMCSGQTIDEALQKWYEMQRRYQICKAAYLYDDRNLLVFERFS